MMGGEAVGTQGPQAAPMDLGGQNPQADSGLSMQGLKCQKGFSGRRMRLAIWVGVLSSRGVVMGSFAPEADGACSKYLRWISR